MKGPLASQIMLSCTMAVGLLGPTQAFAQLGTKLLATDIRAAAAQNTLSYTTTSGRAAKAYLASDGVLRGKYEGKQFRGDWKIHDDMLCFNFPKQNENGCWSVVRLPNGQLQLFTSHGKPAGYIEITRGNPNNF